jgi:hypothetical protein
MQKIWANGRNQTGNHRSTTKYLCLSQTISRTSCGAENGQRGYRLTYAIAYLRDFLFTLDILCETFETSVPWSQIHNGGSISHDRGLGKFGLILSKIVNFLLVSN